MSTASVPPSAQQPTPPSAYILRGLGFLAAALMSLAVESIVRKSGPDQAPVMMRGVYWLLFMAQTLFGSLMVIVIPPWFLSSIVLPWWLRRYDPQQWKAVQAKIAARGGPPSLWNHFTFGCYLLGGLVMLVPIARMLLLDNQ